MRRFRGMREGGAGEHADYWLFLKSGDGLFDAHKVDNWYQFLPIAAHKTLDVDEAEQQYLKFVVYYKWEKFRGCMLPYKLRKLGGFPNSSKVYCTTK